jgi:N-acetylglucosaminyldiphosphoundecaprenol N-acetyl-beta-D-mannosaminyltransferase
MSRAANSSPASPSVLRNETQQGRSVPVDAPAQKEFFVLGVRVDALQIPQVILRMQKWIARRDTCHYIAVTGMHGITEAQHHADFKRVLADADLVVPDGMPLVWIGRLRGHALRRRVYGPELMLTFCQETASTGCRHFLYGGDVGIPERLAEALETSSPGITIAGVYSPPFRPTTPEEDTAVINTINRAAADVLWVGLSTPKQETWMHQHRSELHVPVMVGVGAAFDFLSSRKKQAPEWMRESGFEWLFRLLQEPGRLWKRYLVRGSEFIFLVALDLLGLRDFD